MEKYLKKFYGTKKTARISFRNTENEAEIMKTPG
jgi:hypothetical protein